MHSRPHRELPDGPARLGLQHAAGEDGAPTWPAKLGRFPVTVDASGDHGGVHAALRSSAPDRTCTSVATYFKLATPVPLLEMYTRGCTLHMWYTAAGPAGGGRLPVSSESGSEAARRSVPVGGALARSALAGRQNVTWEPITTVRSSGSPK
jgi:hypothetical protein